VIPVAVEVVVIVVDGKVGYPFFGGTLLLTLSTVYPMSCNTGTGGREGDLGGTLLGTGIIATLVTVIESAILKRTRRIIQTLRTILLNQFLAMVIHARHRGITAHSQRFRTPGLRRRHRLTTQSLSSRLTTQSLRREITTGTC
jgi:hypothetical protein